MVVFHCGKTPYRNQKEMDESNGWCATKRRKGLKAITITQKKIIFQAKLKNGAIAIMLVLIAETLFCMPI